MTKATVLHGGGCCKEGVGSGLGSRRDGVEVARAIAAKNHASRLGFLDRETKGVKFYRTTIIAGKLTNRK